MNKALFGFFQSKMAARGSGFAVQVGNLFSWHLCCYMFMLLFTSLGKSMPCQQVIFEAES